MAARFFTFLPHKFDRSVACGATKVLLAAFQRLCDRDGRPTEVLSIFGLSIPAS
jgi:hypothetical protein